MQKLQNYVLGAWVSGDGDGTPQYNAYTGDIISTASDTGLDYAAILEYGRRKQSHAPCAAFPRGFHH